MNRNTPLLKVHPEFTDLNTAESRPNLDSKTRAAVKMDLQNAGVGLTELRNSFDNELERVAECTFKKITARATAKGLDGNLQQYMQRAFRETAAEALDIVLKDMLAKVSEEKVKKDPEISPRAVTAEKLAGTAKTNLKRAAERAHRTAAEQSFKTEVQKALENAITMRRMKVDFDRESTESFSCTAIAEYFVGMDRNGLIELDEETRTRLKGVSRSGRWGFTSCSIIFKPKRSFSEADFTEMFVDSIDNIRVI